MKPYIVCSLVYLFCLFVCVHDAQNMILVYQKIPKVSLKVSRVVFFIITGNSTSVQSTCIRMYTYIYMFVYMYILLIYVYVYVSVYVYVYVYVL